MFIKNNIFITNGFYFKRTTLYMLPLKENAFACVNFNRRENVSNT